MSYVSFRFVIYVGAVAAAYFLYPVLFRSRKEEQWQVLLAASLVFYGLCSGRCLFLLLLTGASVYGGALWLQRCQEVMRKALSPADGRTLSRTDKKQIRAAAQRKKRRILAAVLLLNFGILAFCKYVPDLVNRFLSGNFLSLSIPIGISFYTFQATGYLIDVYNGNAKAERNPGKVMLFLSFFPQIMQGPISFWDPVAEEMFAEHRADWTRMKHGAELILWGYLRKMVLADRIVGKIYAVTDSYQEYSGTMIVLAVLLYAVQLYADFAGGIDISRGIAEILGIHLPDNFRQPYLSVSLNDYWRRWHITLGAWMKRYIFYPLALTPLFAGIGKKCKKTRFGRTAFGQHTAKVLPAALSCIVVFLVVGIWHGAGGGTSPSVCGTAALFFCLCCWSRCSRTGKEHCTFRKRRGGIISSGSSGPLFSFWPAMFLMLRRICARRRGWRYGSSPGSSGIRHCCIGRSCPRTVKSAAGILPLCCW